MRVTVRVFARLREIVGVGQLEREAPAGATIVAVWRALVADFPALAPYTSSIAAARNLEYASMTTPVGDDDEIAFLPPVSGGAD